MPCNPHGYWLAGHRYLTILANKKAKHALGFFNISTT
jgi:hypothetical protein